MSIDTADKRFSLINLARGVGRVLPVPQGGLTEQGDRQELIHLYRGILAGGLVPLGFFNDVNTQVFMYLTLSVGLYGHDNTSLVRQQMGNTGEASARLKAIIVASGTSN